MKIKIQNLKKIKELEFVLPTQGIWLLTGLNGSGKTSLLASLSRIGSSNAFARHFKTSSLNKKLDLFDTTKITYTIGSDSITYQYGGQRWRGKPSKNSKLFKNFNYSSVKFISADGSRIEPFKDEIVNKNIRQSKNSIKEFMIEVLDDNKWDNLKYINTRRGVGNDAYLLEMGTGRSKYYFSEKNFSLGELSVFKLAKQLSDIEDNSLLLIDEIEIALHPSAQIRLLRRLATVAVNKNLTIIFSTHSATLIKNHDRKKTLFINEKVNNNMQMTTKGVYEVVKGLYPAQILGEIAFDDELDLDFIFYVEDPEAKKLLDEMISLYQKNITTSLPKYKILYVGGYGEVVRMLNNSSQIFPQFIQRFAFLDLDAQESIAEIKDLSWKRLCEAKEVNFLPCTPEVGLINMIEDIDNHSLINGDLKTTCRGQNIQIQNIITSIDYKKLNKPEIKPRRLAKYKVDYIIKKIQISTGENISRTLYAIYSKHIYRNNLGQLKRTFGQIFN